MGYRMCQTSFAAHEWLRPSCSVLIKYLLFLLLLGRGCWALCNPPCREASIQPSEQSWGFISSKPGFCVGAAGLSSSVRGTTHQRPLPLPVAPSRASSTSQRPVCISLGPGDSVEWPIFIFATPFVYKSRFSSVLILFQLYCVHTNFIFHGK